MSLALLSSSAERPSTSRRLTSLPSVAPTMRPAEDTASTTSGSGLFQVDIGWMPPSTPGADRGHRLRLGEDLGVGADADLEVLAPGALADQHLLQRHRLGRAGLQRRQVVADQPGHLGADRRRGGQVAAGALLDHPLQHGDREGHAGRLQRLQIDRRQQPGLFAGCDPRAACWPARRRRRRSRSPRRGAQRGGRVRRLAQVAHGREGRGDVDQRGRRAAPPPTDPGTSGRQTRPASVAVAASSGSAGRSASRSSVMVVSPCRMRYAIARGQRPNEGSRTMRLFGGGANAASDAESFAGDAQRGGMARAS